MNNLVDVHNTLTPEQRKELSEKLDVLIAKYERAVRVSCDGYFAGVADGLNNARKLINEIEDDYLIPPS